MGEGEGRGCQVCHNSRKPLLCPNCVRRGILNDLALKSIKHHKQKLLERVNKALEAQRRKELLAAQQRQRDEARQALASTSTRAAAAEESFRRVLGEAEKLRASNKRRARHLAEASEQLARRRTEQLVHVLPESIQQRTMHLRILSDQLTVARSQRMAALLEVMPLQIPALRPSSPEAGGARGPLGGPLPGAGGTTSHSSKATIPYVKLCGLRLPESFAPYVDDPKEAQETGTVLGYLAQFLQLAAFYLDGPLLHTLGLQGSTSSIWAPRSFWDPEPPTEASVHPLHVRSGAAGATAASDASNSPYTLAAITQQWEAMKNGNSALRPTRRQKEDLAMALRMLWRSTAALLAEHLGADAQTLPSDWNPIASLAVLCAQAARPSARRRAASAQVSLAGSVLLRAAALGAGATMAPEVFLTDDDENEVVDGWDMVQRPAVWQPDASTAASLLGPDAAKYLPPPPSRPVDVLNWERAMFTDSNSVYLTHVAPALTAALPPSALNALLSPFRRGTPGT
ncbi:g9303 [Coccomyxa elongata]